MSSRFFTVTPVAMGALWLYVAQGQRADTPPNCAARKMTKFEHLKGASDKNRKRARVMAASTDSVSENEPLLY